MNQRNTYINGKWVPESAATIHIYDSQFMFGDAVFEMHRTFGHEHFLIHEHVERLWRSMRATGILISKTQDEVISLCDEAIRLNKFDKNDEYRFMINVSHGPLSIYRDAFENNDNVTWGQPTWIINVWPLSKTARTLSHFYDSGAQLHVTSQRQIPSQYLDPKVKNRSRMHYSLANREISGFGKKAIPILLDDDGYICESTGANFIMIKNSTIIIPEQRNILRGCSMEFVVNNLAKKCGFDVVESNIEPYDVYDADEVFLTGTFYNIIPCEYFNNRRIGTCSFDENACGPITKQIVNAWNSHICETYNVANDYDFIDQIRNW